MTFENRQQAGKLLAHELTSYNKHEVIVIAIPRGGVFIGFQIAQRLSAPLTVVGVRKIGLPWNPEFAIGAIAEKNTLLLDEDIIEKEHIPRSTLNQLIRQEKQELQRRVALYRKNQPLPNVERKQVIIADDGLATGFTAKAAILAIAKLHPKSILFASPICSSEAMQTLFSVVDNIVCLATPTDIESIGMWYKDFSQLTDNEVLSCLEKNISQTKRTPNKL